MSEDQASEKYNRWNAWGPSTPRKPSYSHLPGQDTTRDPWAPDEPQAYHNARPAPVQKQPASGQMPNQQHGAYAHQYACYFPQQDSSSSQGGSQQQPQPQYNLGQSGQTQGGYDLNAQQYQSTYPQYGIQQQSSGSQQQSSSGQQQSSSNKQDLAYKFITEGDDGFWKDWTNQIIQSDHFEWSLEDFEKVTQERTTPPSVLRTIWQTAEVWSAEEVACGSDGLPEGGRARAVGRVAEDALRFMGINVKKEIISDR